VTDRRTFVAGLGSLLFTVRVPAGAQPARKPARLGFLRIVAPLKEYTDALEQGLRDRGYIPGRDVAIDYRFADGRADDLQRLATALVTANVDIILSAGNDAVRAARNATHTIPIVMVVASDPVALGFVSSLSHPGANVTGTTIISSALGGKRLELLRELIPSLARAAVLLNTTSAAHQVAFKEMLAAGAALGVAVQPIEVRSAVELDAAFATMAKGRAEALIVLEDAMFVTERARLAGLAARARLPAVYGQRNSVDVGGLMSYGPNILDVYRNAGAFVERILKGAMPADIPVEQPTKFELVINLRTAKALALPVSPALLLRADEVVR